MSKPKLSDEIKQAFDSAGLSVAEAARRALQTILDKYECGVDIPEHHAYIKLGEWLSYALFNDKDLLHIRHVYPTKHHPTIDAIKSGSDKA